MPTGRPTLHTCHFRDAGGSIGHPCGKAARALRDAGHDIDVHVAAVGRPFGIATTGRRPEVKALSGQEKLPVLELPSGEVVVGSGAIVAWAESHRLGAAPAPNDA